MKSWQIFILSIVLTVSFSLFSSASNKKTRTAPLFTDRETAHPITTQREFRVQ
jgi:hypothetical protein